MSSDLLVRGSPKEQASTEVIAWTFDWAARIGAQTISSATATATRLDTGTSVTATTISGAVTHTTTTTTVTVQALSAGCRYRILVLAVLSGGALQASVLELSTPY